MIRKWRAPGDDLRTLLAESERMVAELRQMALTLGDVAESLEAEQAQAGGGDG